MKSWFLYFLVVSLYGDVDVAQGCDFYCCAGNRTAFVEAGWQNCCSEAQCFEMTYISPYDWYTPMVFRQSYYEPQPCNVQCCREMFMDAHCCPDKICRAVDTMDPNVREEFFATDAAQSKYPSPNRVTKSWISFRDEPTTTDGLEDFRRKEVEQKIAAEKRQKAFDTLIRVVGTFIAAIIAGVLGYALRQFCLRNVCTFLDRRASVPETVPLNSVVVPPSAVPATPLPSPRHMELADEIPAQHRKSDLPPTYGEVTGHSPKHNVLSGKR